MRQYHAINQTRSHSRTPIDYTFEEYYYWITFTKYRFQFDISSYRGTSETEDIGVKLVNKLYFKQAHLRAAADRLI